jgi:hypothetical protein
MTLRDSVGDSVWNSVHQHIRYAVSCYVSDAVLLPAWYSVLDNNKNSVRASVGDSVWNSVHACVYIKINDQL